MGQLTFSTKTGALQTNDGLKYFHRPIFMRQVLGLVEDGLYIRANVVEEQIRTRALFLLAQHDLRFSLGIELEDDLSFRDFITLNERLLKNIALDCYRSDPANFKTVNLLSKEEFRLYRVSSLPQIEQGHF